MANYSFQWPFSRLSLLFMDRTLTLLCISRRTVSLRMQRGRKRRKDTSLKVKTKQLLRYGAHVCAKADRWS